MLFIFIFLTSVTAESLTGLQIDFHKIKKEKEVRGSGTGEENVMHRKPHNGSRRSDGEHCQGTVGRSNGNKTPSSNTKPVCVTGEIYLAVVDRWMAQYCSVIGWLKSQTMSEGKHRKSKIIRLIFVGWGDTRTRKNRLCVELRPCQGIRAPRRKKNCEFSSM